MKKKSISTVASARPVLFAAAIVLLASCAVRKDQSGSGSEGVPLEGTYWKLVEINGTPVDTGLTREPFLQLDAEENRVSASGGCNGMGGTYAVKANNRLSFSQLIGTMMACPNMEVESKLSEALERTDSYAIHGDTLSLFRARMAPLARFVAVSESERGAAALNGTWRLDHLGGTAIALDELFPNEKPTITFDVAGLRVSGSGGCNRYTGDFSVDNHTIQFGQIASTRMFCQGVQEDAYFQTLAKINRFSIGEGGTTLNLIVGDVATMRFTRE